MASSDVEIIPNDLEVKDVIPKYVEPNPRGYTELQLAKKRAETADLLLHHPTLSPAWLAMIWDFVVNTPKERIEEIINNKEFEKPSKSGRDVKGGIIKGAVTVRTRTEEELKDRYNPINDFEKVTGRINPLPEDLSGN